MAKILDTLNTQTHGLVAWTQLLKLEEQWNKGLLTEDEATRLALPILGEFWRKADKTDDEGINTSEGA